MAATPFKGTASLLGLSGQQYICDFSASDVANAYTTFDDTGLTFVDIPEPFIVTDVSLSAGGVDTTKLREFVNGKDTGNTHRNGGCVQTVNNRVALQRKYGNPNRPTATKYQLKQLA